MKRIILITISFTLLASSLNAIECKKEVQDLKSVRDIIQTGSKMPQKDITLVDGFRAMFHEGKVSGQLRSVYVQNDLETATNTYATAFGGLLKYETAKFNGVNLGFAMNYSEDISNISGDNGKGKRSDELSSSNEKYAQLSEAYIAYEGCVLDYKLGRQIVDTPLADSDDIRMIPNTFEGIVAQYPSDVFDVTLGFLNRWQGVDAGLDDEWVKTGEDGTTFIGVSYKGVVQSSLWYYNISEQNNAIYADLAYTFEFSETSSLSASIQYLNETEISNSGIEANIFGALFEYTLKDLTFGFAYNTSAKEKGKSSFSGFGGGTLFTNMDTMILDEITQDREASSYVGGVSYALGDFSLLYAYGNFKGENDSLGDKEHIVEQDIGVEYNYNDELVAYIMYVASEDKLNSLSTDNDWNHLRVMVNYNF